jgi:hypothetical protein
VNELEYALPIATLVLLFDISGLRGYHSVAAKSYESLTSLKHSPCHWAIHLFRCLVARIAHAFANFLDFG